MEDNNKMLNFTVGPVMTWNEILSIGGQQIPYFRTEEFSGIMKDSEKMMLGFAASPEVSRSVFLTGSGTMAMEAAVVNTLTYDDKVLIVNGGSFGQRFVDICKMHDIPFEEIKLSIGETLTSDKLELYDALSYTAFLVNMHETSTGVLYDMNIIHNFCQKGDLFLIVDAISAFLADPLDMKDQGINLMITSSQKALACAPGISTLTMDTIALERIEKSTFKSMYMDIKDALKNADRGQTPFTPAVGTLLQINKRLHMIKENGGVAEEISRTRRLAEYFRNQINDLPLEIVSQSVSNAVTCLHPINMSARCIVDKLKKEYNIWVCPNGGENADYMFRVGHIGNITFEDIDVLVKALNMVVSN